MAALRDPRGEIHELYFYEIEGLCENLMNVVSDYNRYEQSVKKMKKEVTRLSSALEFCIHELHWSLLDPYCKDAAYELRSDDLPIMTDELIGYSSNLDSSEMVEGIIDDKGFISFERFTDKEQAASIILMHEMIKNKDLYEKYIRARTLNRQLTAYDFLVSIPNVVGIKRPNPLEEKFVLNYVSANQGKVAEFIEYLKVTNKLVELDIKVQSDNTLMESRGMAK